MDKIQQYLNEHEGRISPEMAYLISSLSLVEKVSPISSEKTVKEFYDQRHNLKLIASENYSSLSVQAAMGSLFTDKYSEGFPFHRFYAGCDNVDEIENSAVEEAKKLFGAEHAYVQPHSGADANLCAYWAILNERVQIPLLSEMGIKNPSELKKEDWDKIRTTLHSQKLLGLDYYCGGHLTHGYRQNISAQLFDAYSYTVDKETGLLDYDEIERMAKEIKPLILLAGYSAYPRAINFRRMAEIAHSVFAESVDKGCPLVIGGPLPHVMNAKLVALKEAGSDSFKDYASRIVENSRALASSFIKRGVKVATGGTDNHLLLIDVTPFGLNGRMAETLLRECGITLNRNALPFDPNGPWYTSGLRLGSAAVTTLGMGVKEMDEIADIITSVLSSARPVILQKGERAGEKSRNKAKAPKEIMESAKKRVEALLSSFLLYPELDLDWLMENFGEH